MNDKIEIDAQMIFIHHCIYLHNQFGESMHVKKKKNNLLKLFR